MYSLRRAPRRNARVRTVTARRLRAPFAVAAHGLLMLACSVGETNTELLEIAARKPKTDTQCTSPFASPDLSKLTSCGQGRGHCFDSTKTSFGNVDACADGSACLPNKVLVANGRPLRGCTFYLKDQPGACVSLLKVDVRKNKDSLKQDVCDADERCVPCVNPTNGESTQVCTPTGVHERSCASSAAEDDTASCCGGLGTCIREDAVPGGSEGKLDGLGCPSEQVCAPRSLVDGEPVKCHAAGLSGVCLGICFAKQLAGAKSVFRGDCGPAQVCLPCAIGSSQDVPGC